MPINPMRPQNYLFSNQSKYDNYDIISQAEKNEIIEREWLLKSKGVNVKKDVKLKANLTVEKEEEIITTDDLEQIKKSDLKCYKEKGEIKLIGFYQSESCKPHTKKPFCVTINKGVKTIIIRKILSSLPTGDYDRDIKMLFLDAKGKPISVKIKINVNTPEEKEETSTTEVLLYNKAMWKRNIMPGP